MQFLLNKLKSKKLGYWLACGAALVALVAMIVYGVYKGKNGYGSGSVYALIIIGIALQIGLFFYDGKFGPVLSVGATIMYALALGYSLDGGIGNITDAVFDITLFGKAALASLNYAIAALLGVSLVLSIVSCFLRREKAKD